MASYRQPGLARPQQGVALVAVLVIVAIVALVSLEINTGQAIFLRQSITLAERAQAQRVRAGGEQFAALSLERDALDNKTDHLNEPWAGKFPPLPAEGGVVTIAISDLQGRFNINNLHLNKKDNPDQIKMFRRLLLLAQVSPEVQNSIMDWLDEDTSFRAQGAEDEYYLGQETAYRAANQPLTHVHELMLVKGMDTETYARLEPLVSALPVLTPVNVNTAPAPVLAALFDNMSLAEADTIVKQRKAKRDGFTSTAEFMNLVNKSHGKPKAGLMATSSNYFEIATQVEFGRYRQQTLAAFQRRNGTQPSRFLGRDRPLVVIKDKDDKDKQDE